MFRLLSLSTLALAVCVAAPAQNKKGSSAIAKVGLEDTFTAKDPKAMARLGVVDRVEAEHDPELDAFVPAKMPNRVELHMRDGSTRSAEVMDSRGTPVHPLSTDGVLEKARALCETVDPDIDLDAIVNTIDQFTDCDDVNDLTGLLTVPSFEEGMKTGKFSAAVQSAAE